MTAKSSLRLRSPLFERYAGLMAADAAPIESEQLLGGLLRIVARRPPVSISQPEDGV